VLPGPLEGRVDVDDVVAPVRFDDAYLVGTNLLIYANFVCASDNGLYVWFGVYE
jgi:hypothetical protein